MTATKAKTRAAARPPVRRMSGLESLQRRGRISRSQRAAGEAYGAVWRRSRAEGSLPSSLSAEAALGLGRGISAPDPGRGLTAAEARLRARHHLAALRRRLKDHPALVAACDRICGQELTPREAAGADREAGRLEAVLAIALDLLLRE
ncbi:MAG: hypothetical protein RL588_2566 [Pseudomonadota bacterium]